jgi:hypothetical protein
MRFLVWGLLDRVSQRYVDIPPYIRDAFENKHGIEIAQGKLTMTRKQSPFGEDSICRYLGGGKPEKAHRSPRQIREAILQA